MDKHTPNHELASYEGDFHLWSQTQAALIRAGRLGRRDWLEIRSRLEFLLVHLLKWQFQPQKRKCGWRSSIDGARLRQLFRGS